MGLKVTPLAGGVDDTEGILAFLLEVDDARILLDCGARDRPFDSAASVDVEEESSRSAERQQAYHESLTRLGPTLDLVLLSHPLLSCVGALPFLKSRGGLRCPVYATLPVKELGRKAAEEWSHQRYLEEDLTRSDTSVTLEQPPLKRRKMSSDGDEADVLSEIGLPHDLATSKDAVSAAFDSIIGVRYSQPIHLGGKLQGTIAVAHQAAHSLGGTLWSLRSPLHSVATSAAPTVLYAPIFNHVKEYHLDGTSLLVSGAGGLRVGEGMARPNMLIVGAERALTKAPKRRDRDASFLRAVTQTLETSNSVFIPCDASARILELLCLLEKHWASNRLLEEFPICVVSTTGKDVLAFAQSLTEWLGGDATGSHFEGPRRSAGSVSRDGGALHFRHVKFYPNVEAFKDDLPPAVPKVVLAAPASMSHGFARRLFLDMAPVPGNLIILTSLGDEGTLFRRLAEAVNRQLPTASRYGIGQVSEPIQSATTVVVMMHEKIALAGKELADHIEAKRKASKLRNQLTQARAAVGGVADESDSEDSDDEVTAEAVPSTEMAEAADSAAAEVGVMRRPNATEFVDERDFTSASFDVLVRGQDDVRRGSHHSLAHRFRVFPFIERKRRVDAYGEVVDVEGWLKRAEDSQGSQDLGERPDVDVKSKEAAKLDNIPYKYISSSRVVRVACRLLLLDMEAKADGQALKTIIPQINPKATALVKASKRAAQSLEAALTEVPQFTRQVGGLSVGESRELGDDVKSFPLRLGDRLLSSLRLSKVEGFEIVQIVATLQNADDAPVPTLEKAAIAKGTEGVGMHSGPKASHDDSLFASLPPASLFIGDLRLAALKAQLRPFEVQASLAGGGLLVCKMQNLNGSKSKNHVVTVRKANKGELIIEGSAGQLFSTVKKVVYAMHASTS